MGSILLVDDDDQLRLMLSIVLERAGHRVHNARNGREAINLYKSREIDVVVTDLIMPEKEGLSTILELRRFDKRARIIAMSGGVRTGPQDYLHVAQRFGAESVLAKPFSHQQLLAAVNKLLAAPE